MGEKQKEMPIHVPEHSGQPRQVDLSHLVDALIGRQLPSGGGQHRLEPHTVQQIAQKDCAHIEKTLFQNGLGCGLRVQTFCDNCQNSQHDGEGIEGLIDPDSEGQQKGIEQEPNRLAPPLHKQAGRRNQHKGQGVIGHGKGEESHGGDSGEGHGHNSRQRTGAGGAEAQNPANQNGGKRHKQQGNEGVEKRQAVADAETLGQACEQAQRLPSGGLAPAGDVGNVEDRVIIDDVVEHAIAVSCGSGDYGGEKRPTNALILKSIYSVAPSVISNEVRNLFLFA